MKFTTILPFAFVLFLAGCAGGTGVTVSDTVQQEQDERPVNILGPGETYIVHVDKRERIVTIRNAGGLEEGYYIAIAKDSSETAALKLLPRRSSGLRTADVLEGEPSINNRIRKAGAARAAELAKIYRDPAEDSE